MSNDYNEADAKFMKEMIPHHEEAKKMAKKVYESGKNPEVKKLAKEIYNAQDGEIKQMKEWLKKRNLESGSSLSALLNKGMRGM
jgi:uncharacterized protein (DUF305 family)